VNPDQHGANPFVVVAINIRQNLVPVDFSVYDCRLAEFQLLDFLLQLIGLLHWLVKLVRLVDARLLRVAMHRSCQPDYQKQGSVSEMDHGFPPPAQNEKSAVACAFQNRALCLAGVE
jgi:hypothetical protein